MLAPAASLRVVIADDDGQLRDLMARLLRNAGHQVVGSCGDAREVVELVREQRPDEAILDMRMPPRWATDGLDAALQIRRELPRTAVLLLSAEIAVEHAIRVLEGGTGSGYLLKSRLVEPGFVETIERLAAGASLVDSATVAELMAAAGGPDPLASLGLAERELLALVAEGRSNAEIARRSGRGEAAVERDVAAIFNALELGQPHDERRRTLAVLGFLDGR
jgi:DNA-binding NarL/FixJ family response regulator